MLKVHLLLMTDFYNNITKSETIRHNLIFLSQNQLS